MSQVGELKVRIIGDDSDLQKSLDRSNKKLKQWGAEAKRSAGIATAVFGTALVMATKKVIASTAAFENMSVALGMATSSIEEHQRALNFVKSEANRTGKSIVTVGESYKQLAAAARGTSIEGAQTEKIFKAVGNASLVMGLSAEQTRGTFRALEQMISKGNIQAEELRGQLGERLPGSFQITARAMGVSTQELNKMLDRGEVMASEVLPKLADELEKTFGPSVPKSLQNISFAVNNAQSAFEDLFVITDDNKSVDDLKTSLNDLAKILRDKQTKEGFASLASALVKITGLAAKAATHFTQIGKGIGIIAGQIAVGDNSVVGQLNKNQEKLKSLYAQREKLLQNYTDRVSNAEKTPIVSAGAGFAFDAIPDAIKNINEEIKKLEYVKDVTTDFFDDVVPADAAEKIENNAKKVVEAVVNKEEMLKKLKDEYVASEIDQEAMLIEQKRQMQDEQTMYNIEQMKKEDEARKEYANSQIKYAIDKARKMKEAEQTFWSDINTSATSGSEKMQKIMQKIAIARAVVTGYESAVNAWNAGMATGGPWAPAVAAAYTAASLAKTGALISSMKSGSSSTGGGGSSASSATATTQAAQEPSRIVSLNFQGGDYERGMAGNLVSMLNDEIKRGGKIEGVVMA